MSDHDSDISQLPVQEVQGQLPCFSQGSFGGTSQISSAVGALPKSQPVTEQLSLPADAATKVDITGSQNVPRQEELEDFTIQVKEKADAL